MTQSRLVETIGPSNPWWRYPIVWMVIGGPAAVVVAGIVTAIIAVNGADEVLPREPQAQFADRPAVQGRNHSATAAQEK
jgi:uncharacterized protein